VKIDERLAGLKTAYQVAMGQATAMQQQAWKIQGAVEDLLRLKKQIEEGTAATVVTSLPNQEEKGT